MRTVSDGQQCPCKQRRTEVVAERRSVAQQEERHRRFSVLLLGILQPWSFMLQKGSKAKNSQALSCTSPSLRCELPSTLFTSPASCSCFNIISPFFSELSCLRVPASAARSLL
eukprot:RCo017379